MDVLQSTQVWPVAVGFLGLVVWAVRLEGKTLATHERQRALEARNARLEEIIRDKLSTIETTLARMEGYLERERNQDRNHE